VFYTVKGKMPVSLYESDTVRFAGFLFDESPVLVAPRGAYNLGGNTDSIVGMDMIQQFTVRIDYPRQRIWLRREKTAVTYLGTDYASTREAGAFLYRVGNTYRVIGITPDSPAEKMGLQPGDVLVQPELEELRPLEETMAMIVRGEPILVARSDSRGNWIDIALPLGSELEMAPLATDQRDALREEAERSDREKPERWEREKASNVYAETRGGWVLVDGHRLRRGPQEGEVWVSFEEMQQLKAERAAKAEASAK
jgi:hypothetical protein